MAQQLKIVGGPWCGGVTDTSAVVKASVKAKTKTAAGKLRLRLAEKEDLSQNAQVVKPVGGAWEDQDADYERYIVTFKPSGLAPKTGYHYALVSSGQVLPFGRGNFETFAPSGERVAFRFASSSCDRGQLDETFRAIAREDDLLLFLHAGDLYYDIDETLVGERLETYDKVMRRRGVRQLLSGLSVAYTWDDHDFLGNNSHGSRNGGGAARKAYQIYVPHAELAKPSDGIYHSFDVGNVTFVMTDTRSRKSPPGDSDGPGKTMLGNKQKKWLMDTLSRNRDRDLVFWINSVPWLADAEEGKEHWAGYSTERAELVEFLNTERLNNLCMISGDAHMLAYKRAKADGETHPWDWGGFPIFHTASLGSPGSRKGNGYSVRPKKGWGQWGVFTVTYPDNDHVAVSWRGRRLQQVLPQAKHFPGVFEDRGQFFQVRNAKSGGRVMKYVYKRRIV